MSERSSVGYHAALASSARRHVLELLTVATGPVDARTIADALGRHVTTVRFHLEQLETAGLVHRETNVPPRRGRPRLLYALTVAPDQEENSRDRLIGVLADALAGGESDLGRSRALDAGKKWARTIISEMDDVEDGSHPARRTMLLKVLDRLGFQPSSEDSTIQLLACPFRDAARAHPQVVCSVHSGLVQEILQSSDALGEMSLVPFVQSDRCAIALG